jgi:hypothetical protein
LAGINIATHLEQRLAEHNAEKSPYTSSFYPSSGDALLDLMKMEKYTAIE